MPSVRVTGLDPQYPQKLRALPRPPPELFFRGAIPTIPGIAVVGTRHPSAPARRFAFDLGAALAARGFAVWSGGALGIDQAAHLGALRARGRTVLCAGAGLDHPYPKNAPRLYAILERRGALIAIRPDGDSPKPWTFLERNGVLAAMTEATVVVECGLKSGARSTAAAARRLGRPVFIAQQPPWSPTQAAVREEARLGAHVFATLDELLAGLARTARSPIEPDLQPIAALLADGPRHVDELCARLGLPAPVVVDALLRLRFAGHVEELAPGLHRLAP